MATVRPALFLYVETEPAIRIWTGSKPYPLAADEVDLDGGDYLALALSSVPAIDRLIDDQAGEYELSISGIDAAALALLDVPDDLPGARAHLGQMKFDAQWQPLGGVDWLADFDAEAVSWSLTRNDDGDGQIAGVSLRLGTASTDRRLASLLHWSPVEQAIVSPTDLFFEFVPTISIGTTRQYPA